jgi:heparan-alpha-glucosaminide N-acetyltransferase
VKTDPEGLISTITASLTTFVGYLFGLMVLRLKKTPERLIKYWLAFAVVCAALIYPCHLFMPFNKRLYTIPFVLVNLSSCATVLSLFVLLADLVPKYYPQAKSKIVTVIQPLNWLGLNPLAVFILLTLSRDTVDQWIVWGNDDTTPYVAFYNAAFSWMGAYIGTLVYTVFYGVVLTLAAGVLYHYKLFLRL